MRQPIIDPDKVGAWMGSMNGVFAATTIGLWLAVALTLGFLVAVILLAMSDSHHKGKRGA